MKLAVLHANSHFDATIQAPYIFEQQYIALRTKEQRIYTDTEVACLPEIDKDHVHFKEWLIRKSSCQKLIRHLRSKKQALKILEIGCGNGWLSSRLSDIQNSEVTGMDINQPELDQAGRIFHEKKKLSFVNGDIRSGILKNDLFDVIVFAASIQYFSSLGEIIQVALHHLKPGGEIHITDTCFYKSGELETARQRTSTYFSQMGFPLMLNNYFHHCIDELGSFDSEILYNPRSLMSRIVRMQNSFYWIRIKKD